ncbi:MAG: 2-hydroxyacid dehydrogenase [candidate division NC10 bacterium]
MLRVAFVGATPGSLAERVRRHLATECELLLTDENGAAGVLPEVDVLVTFVFTREMAAAARRLKLIQVPGAGLDRIDLAAVPSGSRVANVYGHDNGIAEYVLGVMLALGRGFCRMDAAMREGRWEGSWVVSAPPRLELAGKTLGLLGYGRIGGRLSQFAQALGMEVWALRRGAWTTEPAGPAFRGGPDDLDKVLERADYLVIALPLTPETRGLLGARQLWLMKPTAFLINVARAEIVDEAALYEALREGTIAGAALDVWYQYPKGSGPAYPSRFDFHRIPNVLMTPHVSAWTEETQEGRAKLMAGNIDRVARGEPPLNLVPTS